MVSTLHHSILIPSPCSKIKNPAQRHRLESSVLAQALKQACCMRATFRGCKVENKAERYKLG